MKKFLFLMLVAILILACCSCCCRSQQLPDLRSGKTTMCIAGLDAQIIVTSRGDDRNNGRVTVTFPKRSVKNAYLSRGRGGCTWTIIVLLDEERQCARVLDANLQAQGESWGECTKNYFINEVVF